MAVFTNLTLRFTLLRLVCGSTILQLIQILVRMKRYFQQLDALYIYYTMIVILGVVLVHHVASAFGPRFSLPGLLDLLLLFAEIGLFLQAAANVASWYPRDVVFYFVLLWTTSLSLVLLALQRIGESIHRGWRYLWTRYDITGAKWAHKRESENDIIQEPIKGYHVIFGSSLWKTHFLGESKAIVICRGICGVLLIVAIPIFSVFVLIIEPVYETGLTPFKGMKSEGLPLDFKPTDEPVWNVIVSRTRYWVEGGDNNPDFSPAIRVTPLWNLNNNNSRPPCNFVGEVGQTYSPGDKFTFDALWYYCPPRMQIPKDTRKSFIPWYDEDIRPDLLVTANFTMLNISSDSIVDGAINSVQVMVGLTNNTDDVFAATTPATLFPGMNVVGMSSLSIRQKFGKAAIAALGIVESYETFLVSEIVALSPDPQASRSNLIPRSPGVATLRIISKSDSAAVTVIQDYRQKSVVNGFSTVGGLWAFLGGMFIAFFGSSIKRILFGTKPISAFGLARSFKGDNIREAYLQAYPRLLADLKTKPEHRGLVSFISDHLVDFGFLAKGADDSDYTDAQLHDEKQTTNYGQETAVLLSSNAPHAHLVNNSAQDAVGLRIWGFDPNEGISEYRRK